MLKINPHHNYMSYNWCSYISTQCSFLHWLKKHMVSCLSSLSRLDNKWVTTFQKYFFRVMKLLQIYFPALEHMLSVAECVLLKIIYLPYGSIKIYLNIKKLENWQGSWMAYKFKILLICLHLFTHRADKVILSKFPQYHCNHCKCLRQQAEIFNLIIFNSWIGKGKSSLIQKAVALIFYSSDSWDFNLLIYLHNL